MKTNSADKWFSRFIRLRDAKQDDLGQCCTCGKWDSIKHMDNGHYIKRQHQATRYHEKNCALQCKHCNSFEQGADAKFRQHLVDRWGENTVLLLESSKRHTVKRSTTDLKQIENYYKQKVTELLKEKCLKKWW